MLRYLARRVPSAVIVLFLASVLIFAIIRLIPGDPASTLAGPDASPASIAAPNTRPPAIPAMAPAAAARPVMLLRHEVGAAIIGGLR